jgi:hypothetical protein
MWTVKFFACFIVPIKWPTLRSLESMPKANFAFHLFKAQDLSVDTFSGRKNNSRLRHMKTAFVFMDCLKYFGPNSYPSCLESLMVSGVPKTTNNIFFMTVVSLFYMASWDAAMEERGTKSIPQGSKNKLYVNVDFLVTLAHRCCSCAAVSTRYDGWCYKFRRLFWMTVNRGFCFEGKT